MSTEKASLQDHFHKSQDIRAFLSEDVMVPAVDECPNEFPLTNISDFCEDFDSFIHSSSESYLDSSLLSPLSQTMLHDFGSLPTLEGSSPSREPGNSTVYLEKLQTPLHMAVHKGSTKIVKLLLHHGADCNVTDAKNMTPLAHAVIGNHGSVTELLLAHGARLTAIDDAERSALHLAVLYRHERLLKTITHHCGEDRTLIDCPDTEGKTPLHVAIDLDLEAAVELLCEAGADLQLKYGDVTRLSHN